MLTAIFNGLIAGAVIGLVALGLVLVYKGSRVFNFAQGEFGTLAIFFLYFLSQVVKIPYVISILLALVGVAAVGFLLERLIVRPLFDAPRVTLLVATAGFALLSIAMELMIGGTQQRPLPPVWEAQGLKLPGTTFFLSPQRAITLIVLAALAVGSAYFFNKTDLGLAVLATSQESVATELVGISTKRMSSFVWTTAAVLGGIAGILVGGLENIFTPAHMTRNFLLLGFTAAVLGGITSLAGAFVGGLLIGLIRSVGSYLDFKYIHEVMEIPALPELLAFIVFVAVLLVRPKGLLGTEA